MTLEEKMKIIKESKEKNYLYISPRVIQSGATLIDSYETLELYENMNENTSKFAEKEIANLIATSKCNNQEARNYLDFNLIFCGNFDDLLQNTDSPIDFIMNNRDRIVAVYRYVTGTETRHFFVRFDQTETVNKYGYLYLNLEKLLKVFEVANISFEIETAIDRYTPFIYRDDSSTRFVISYNPKKELENGKGHQLKKVKSKI